MIIGNLRSKNDYVKKMGEYKHILDVAIANEKSLQAQQDTLNYNNVNGIPNAPPPPERTPTEIVQDIDTQRKLLINSLASLNINYEVIRNVITELSVDDIVILNSHFPMVKSDIQKKFNVKLITTDFLLAYLLQYVSSYERVRDSANPNANKNQDDYDFGTPIEKINYYDDDQESLTPNVQTAFPAFKFSGDDRDNLMKKSKNELATIAMDDYGISYNKIPKKSKMIDDIEEVINKQKSGSGIRKIKRKKQTGKGITKEDKEINHRMFGNYKINIPKLKANILHVAYKCGSPVRNIQARYISDEFKDFIENFLETNKFNESIYKNLSDAEKKHFFDVVHMHGSGIYKQMDIKLKNPFYQEEQNDMRRFEILRSEIEAGNDNRDMIKELKSLILKLSKSGKISRREAMQTIEELTILGF
jgi:hypothetical protein